VWAYEGIEKLILIEVGNVSEFVVEQLSDTSDGLLKDLHRNSVWSVLSDCDFLSWRDHSNRVQIQRGLEGCFLDCFFLSCFGLLILKFFCFIELLQQITNLFAERSNSSILVDCQELNLALKLKEPLFFLFDFLGTTIMQGE